MTKVNIYLNFAGNTEEVFNFYKSVFSAQGGSASGGSGEFISVVRFKDMP